MPAAVNFLQATNNNTSQNTYTYSAQNFGSAAGDRHIVVIFAGRASGLSALTTTCSIAGISATSVVTQVNTNANLNRLSMFIASVPSGASGDVVVTCSRNALRSLIAAYRLTGIDSATPFATASSIASSPNGVITIPAEGIAIAGAMSAGNTLFAWTNLTERSDEIINTNTGLSTASDAFATLQTSLSITAQTNIPTEQVGVFAAWSPSAGGSSNYRRNHALIGC